MFNSERACVEFIQGILASPIIASSLTALGSYKLAIAGACVQLVGDMLLLKESLPKE